jgi:hypothetical protein
MERDLVLAIPGPWKSRSEFTTAVVGATEGQFMFAGPLLANQPIPALAITSLSSFATPTPR